MFTAKWNLPESRIQKCVISNYSVARNSACHEPFETCTKRTSTRSLTSMKPCPTLHLSDPGIMGSLTLSWNRYVRSHNEE